VGLDSMVLETEKMSIHSMERKILVDDLDSVSLECEIRSRSDLLVAAVTL